LWYIFHFFFMGFSYRFGLVVYSYAREHFPITISGTVFPWITFFTMAGAAVFMPVLGKIVESYPHLGRSYPEEAYHFSFLIGFLSMVASLLFFAFPKRRRASR
jgi:hypothetical protein